MNMKLYTLRDTKSGHFQKPIVAPHHAPLIREYSESVNDDKSLFSKFPSDFDLYEIGEFDPISAKLTPLKTPLHIVCLATLKTETTNG